MGTRSRLWQILRLSPATNEKNREIEDQFEVG